MPPHWSIRAYVPKHVNRDSIVKCFADKNTEFIDVATEQEAVDLEAANKDPFLVFEEDHFIVHNSPEGTVKCSYWSRNCITQLVHPNYAGIWNRCTREQDGLKTATNPAVIYFVPTGSSIDPPSEPVEISSVLVYYDNIDLGDFVQTVKRMVCCFQGLFVVAYDNKFKCVEAEDTDNSMDVSVDRIGNFLLKAWNKPEYIRKCAKQAHFLKEHGLKRLPDGQFKLKDYLGNEVVNGERFRLTRDINRYHSYYADENRHDEEPNYSGMDMSDGFLMMYPGDDSIFTSETIDDIVYIKFDNQYLYCQEGSDFEIELTPELPEKEERLHLQHDGSTLILARWDMSGYAIEDWLDHRGYINFEYSDSRWKWVDPLDLHLVKL
ncbi:hypothetical protein DL89DRAFT_266406 [Linderina pennispora]|uniref:Uncharacterized protein n=1 Tax=Linderina pennispora TaxID=61395 RepID=A0A1Y1WCZ3_9FUNG|nr:uncharacterized protein DL89DRAFT_266406 [Linderina pennispora]ORX71400.1 hypothetical protein DL89DRAFT_266406 [Linderina pennispora]